MTNRILINSVLICSSVCFLLVACSGDNEVTELEVKTLHKPDDCKREARRGDMLTMHYRGTLSDGTEFDSSFGRDEPFKFQLGVGQVIKGWDQGLVGVCEGEKRKLVIPSELGYGEHGAGDKIPGGATLHFEIECLEVADGPPPVNVFSEIDSNSDNLLSREEVSDYLKKQLPAAAEAGLGDLPDQDKLVEEIFQHEDSDKNGFISHDEFSGPKHDEL